MVSKIFFFPSAIVVIRDRKQIALINAFILYLEFSSNMKRSYQLCLLYRLVCKCKNMAQYGCKQQETTEIKLILGFPKHSKRFLEENYATETLNELETKFGSLRSTQKSSLHQNFQS